MECRAEINRFAIFLLCLLVPLGSMAPTKTSESKATPEQRQNHFTTKLLTLVSITQQNAHELFEFYNKCISATFHSEPQRIMSKARDMADRIPKCPAFHANCCALHHTRNTLQTLEGAMETICNETSKGVLEKNLSQLNTTLSQGTAFYTCSSQEPPQGYPQVQNMTLANRKTYIWWVLKRYEDIMQLTGNLYSEAAV